MTEKWQEDKKWYDVCIPAWDWLHADYRVKSEFKDGDILFVTSLNSWIFIFKENENKRYIYKYVAVPICTFDTSIYIGDATLCNKKDISEIRFATEEEKQKLFDILKENNYHWNAETKTLEKIKFDITALKPFDKVLVRTNKFDPIWTIDFYDGYRPKRGGSFTPFAVTGSKYFQQCIPYEGNEHLLGKTNDCDDFYKTWE